MFSLTPAQKRHRELKEQHRRVLDGCEKFCDVIARAFAEQRPGPDTPDASGRQSDTAPSIDSIRLSRALGAGLASIKGRDPHFVEGYSRMLGALGESCRQSGVVLWDGLPEEDE